MTREAATVVLYVHGSNRLLIFGILLFISFLTGHTLSWKGTFQDLGHTGSFSSRRDADGDGLEVFQNNHVVTG